MENDKPDMFYMTEALKQAAYAAQEDEVPVGCVIAYGGRIIARAYNQVEKLRDPTAHAEMIAITQAADAMGNHRLLEATLYVTCEPCAMCAGAMVHARIKRVVYGASEPKMGCAGSVMDILRDTRLNHRCEVVGGVMAEESAKILREFFERKRRKDASKPADN